MRLGFFPVCPIRENNQCFAKKHNLSINQVPIWEISNLDSVKKLFKKNHDAHAIISCISSRTGVKKDTWDVDFALNMHLLNGAKFAGIKKFIYLSAICVQVPKLNFQYAKLAFEKNLENSKIDYTIVRPTAFFKSLSGQIKRIKQNKKFIVFDNGKKTKSKPISGEDLSEFIVSAINNKNMKNKIIPIGGPGPARTFKEFGELIFQISGLSPKYFYFPSFVFKILIYIMKPFSLVSVKIADKIEFLKIAHYYATESMLEWDEKKLEYSDNKTQEFGDQKIESYYESVLNGELEFKTDPNQKIF